ncbi:MAG TPA: HD domain-containing phosphohydrolase [Candidatus Ozemobacteraceae bacterium]|nr:HD domain-containing phosphohydrolase [Candidatus Ozemobacteraceae bacterium]
MAIYILNLALAVACTWLAWRYFDLQERLQMQQIPDLTFLAGISGIIDSVEGYAEPHATDMAREARAIARHLKLDERTIASLHIACLLHDCGMANIPREIVKQPRALNADEWFLVKTHPLLGELALRRHVPVTEDVPSIIRWHHEKWDGSGYPDHLVGDEIPLAARILAVVDAAASMKVARSYRKALNPEQIRVELGIQSGLHFDPVVVRAREAVCSAASSAPEGRP